MRRWLRKVWPVLKWILLVAILFGVGRVFYRDLKKHPDLWQQPLHPGWIALSGVLYLLGMGCFAFFWSRLLRRLGQRLSPAGTIKAYFVALMGKYLPGKLGALVFRAEIAGAHGIPHGIGYVTSFYEVLTTMSAGALLAAILLGAFAAPAAVPFDWKVVEEVVRLEQPEGVAVGREMLVTTSLGLFLVIGFFVVPPVFNRLVRVTSIPFRDAAPLPRLRYSDQVLGLACGSVGWTLMGFSLIAALEAVMNQPVTWDVAFVGRMAGYVSLGYVAGFVIVWMPSGLGVRELFLTLLLTPEIRSRFDVSDEAAVARAVWTVILLRLSWTAAEVVMAGATYWLPDRAEPQPPDSP